MDVGSCCPQSHPGQEEVCIELQPEALRGSRDTSGHFSFTSSDKAAINDRHPVPISKAQSSNLEHRSGRDLKEAANRWTCSGGSRGYKGHGCEARRRCPGCDRAGSKRSSASAATAGPGVNTTESPFHNILKYSQLQRMVVLCRAGDRESTCHHCCDLSSQSKGLPNSHKHLLYKWGGDWCLFYGPSLK